MKRLLTFTLVAMASVMMFAQHPQDLRIAGPVSTIVERISKGGYKFGELTQDANPFRIDSIFLYSDARIGAIWRGIEGGYFIDYKYNAENLLLSIDDRSQLLYTEYIYEGTNIVEVNTYADRSRRFVSKRKYYTKNGLKTSILYDANGKEISGAELYIYGKQKYDAKKFPGYRILTYSGKKLTKSVDGSVATLYTYNQSGDLATIKSAEGKTITTRAFSYTYDSFGNWTKCTEKTTTADGSESYLFYDRDITYQNTDFQYVDPVQRYDAAVAAEAARVQAAREKQIKDSIRARERSIQDSILYRERQLQDSLRQAEQQRVQAKQQEVEAQRKAQMADEMAAIKSADCFRTNIINIDKNETGEIKKLTIDANGVFYILNFTPVKYTEKEVVSNGKYVCYKGEGTDNYIVLEYEEGKIDDAYFILDAHTKDTKVNEHYEFDGAALKTIKKHFK